MEFISCSYSLEKMYWLIVIVVAVMVLSFLVWASASIGSGVYLKALCRKKTEEKIVAITFDDGPSPMTPKVLEVLERHGVKACFFLIGSKIVSDKETVRMITDAGHVVGNHSWSHTGSFPLKSLADVQKEIDDTAHAILECTGRKPMLFRPPFGVTNPRIGKAVRMAGLTTIGWNVRSMDTLEGRTREEVMKKISGALYPGSVILLHDRCNDSDLLLEMLLTYLEDNDYKVVTIEEMFDTNAYA